MVTCGLLSACLVVGAASPAPAVRHLVILGSSTPEGVGASSKERSWVGLYERYAASLGTGYRVTNLARSAYTPAHLLPTGDPQRNLTRAIELGAEIILVNLPLGIGARAHEPAESFLTVYRELRRLADAAGVTLWFTTSLPKDTVDDAGRACLRDYRDRILAEFAPRVLDFWTPVATADGHIRPELNADGTHLNDEGHRRLFEEARRTGLFGERELPSPAKILFVGNSLTFAGGGIDVAFRALAAASGRQVTTARATAGGLRLTQHLQRPETLAAIDRGGFDYVVLQDYSAGPVLEPEGFATAGRALIERVRQAGARPILYMTWTYAQDFRGVTVADKAMTRALANAYSTLGQELDVPVVPVGLAWQRALDQTDLKLYADLHHPNEVGAYLVGCVFYAALYNRSPVGLPRPDHPALDAATVTTLQRLAWEAWLEYDRR